MPHFVRLCIRSKTKNSSAQVNKLFKSALTWPLVPPDMSQLRARVVARLYCSHRRSTGTFCAERTLKSVRFHLRNLKDSMQAQTDCAHLNSRNQF